MGFTPIDESEIVTASSGVSGFTPISNDEIMPTQPAAQPDFIDSIWSGIKNTPSTALNLAKAIPTGVSNLVHLPGDLYNAGLDAKDWAASEMFDTPFIPRGTAEEAAKRYGRAENTLKGMATIGTGIATGGVGGGVLSSAVTAGAGLTGLDKLLQAVGISKATTPEEDVASLGTNIGTGIGFGATAKAVESLTGKASDLANTIDRKSLGTRQSDYGKASDSRTVESPSGVTETFVKSSLNDLLENNKLGLSRDPAKVSKIVEGKSLDLATKIDDVITKFDESGAVPAEPYFGGAVEYLKSGKVPADLIPSYLEKLKNLDDAIRQEGKGSLSFLQQQKVALGKSYDPADKVLSGFNRAIYKDLKTSIEQYAPEIKPLNQELAKYIVTEPIVNRALKASENTSPLTQLRDLLWSTGGIGVPTYVGSVLGGPVGTAVGAGVGLGTKALASPTGQALIARVLRNGPAVEGAAEAVSQLSKPENLTTIYSGPNAERSSKLSELLNKTAGKKMEKLPVSQVIEEVKKDPVDHAIMLLESGGKVDAKNPNSTASGLFQLLKGTAKSLGVKDVFNAADNYEGYKKLKQETIDRFGKSDPATIYAAHYLGAPTLQKVLDGEPLTDAQKEQVKELQDVLLPRLMKIYNGLVEV